MHCPSVQLKNLAGVWCAVEECECGALLPDRFFILFLALLLRSLTAACRARSGGAVEHARGGGAGDAEAGPRPFPPFQQQQQRAHRVGVGRSAALPVRMSGPRRGRSWAVAELLELRPSLIFLLLVLLCINSVVAGPTTPPRISETTKPISGLNNNSDGSKQQSSADQQMLNMTSTYSPNTTYSDWEEEEDQEEEEDLSDPMNPPKHRLPKLAYITKQSYQKYLDFLSEFMRYFCQF